MSEESRKKALVTAADILQYQQRSAAALYDRLLEKGIDSGDAEFAVARIKELGYLNDEEYAAAVVSSLRARGYGKSRMVQVLRKKKLDSAAIDRAMEDYSTNREKLLKYIEVRLKNEPAPDRKAIKKLSDGLFRRGYSWEEIREALRTYLDSEDMNDFEQTD